MGLELDGYERYGTSKWAVDEGSGKWKWDTEAMSVTRMVKWEAKVGSGSKNYG